MRILVIEDEQKIALAIKKGLEQESFAVDTIHNGRRGLNYALDEAYDLIILDRMLPDITDGAEICQQIREQGIHTPILMLTAKDLIGDRVHGLNAGADDYLVKPFAFEELVARVRALLRRPHETQGTILTLSDLHIDTTNMRVTRNNHPIALSAKEYALLEYLVRNAGRTCTKDQIITHVWDDDADILPNTVEVYIGYLRNKIDKPFSENPLIHTVRGFGYCIGDKA